MLNAIWYCFTIAGLAACFKLSVTLAQRLVPGRWSESDVSWLYLGSLVLTAQLGSGAISNQSYDVAIVLLVLCGLVALSDGRPAWAGAAFGVATALKATPLLFLPYLLVTRRFTAAAFMSAILVFVSYLPDIVLTQSFHGPGSYLAAWLAGVGGPALSEDSAPHMFWSATYLSNASLRGLVGLIRHDGDRAFLIILYSVLALYAAVVAAIVLRSYRRPWAITTDGALLLLSMLLMSPFTSASHYIALILCYTIVVVVWLTDAMRMRAIAGWFIVLLFLTALLTSHDLVGRAVKIWAYGHRVTTYAMLSLLVFFAIFVDRRVRQEADVAAFKPVSARAPDQRGSSEIVPDHAENAPGQSG